AAALAEIGTGVVHELDDDPGHLPLKEGSSGALVRAGGVLSGPVPLLLRLFGARKAAAVAAIAGSLLTRYGWVAAGHESARDPAGRLGLDRPERGGSCGGCGWVSPAASGECRAGGARSRLRMPGPRLSRCGSIPVPAVAIMGRYAARQGLTKYLLLHSDGASDRRRARGGTVLALRPTAVPLPRREIGMMHSRTLGG